MRWGYRPQSLPLGYNSTTQALLPKGPITSLNSTTSIQNMSLWENSSCKSLHICGGLRLMLGIFSPLLSSLFFLRQGLSVKARAHQYGYAASSGDFLSLLSDIGIIGGLPYPFCTYVCPIGLNSGSIVFEASVLTSKMYFQHLSPSMEF